MHSALSRAFGTVVEVRRGEGAGALLMFAYSFLAMTSFNVLKPLTKSKFIADLGADNLPWVLLAAGVLIGVLMEGYGRLVQHAPPRHVIPITQAIVVALLLVFWVLLQTGAVWVTAALYFFGLILGVLLISQFWTLANDVYDARQAKRLFGFIGGGASLGGVMGGVLTVTMVSRVGADNLLLVSAAMLAACAAIVALIVSRQAVEGGRDVSLERGVGGREAIRILRESRHLKVMALIIGCAVGGATIVDQQLSMAVEAMKGSDGEEGIAAFLARVGVYSSAAGFVVQVALTSRIHRSLGLAFALLMLPVALGTSAAVILLSGALGATAAARVLDLTLRYTVDKTTREILFLPLPADLKYRAKPFIDVTAEKFAKAVVAILLLLLIKGFGFDYRRLSYASLVMTALWIVTALVARREYLSAFRASVGAQTIAPSAIRADVADAATVETLVEELANPDESAVLYAMQMLEAIDKRHLITPLLLHHDSPRVRSRTLLALASTRSRFASRWVASIERMVQDEDVDVRSAALAALASLSHQDAAALMRRHLDDAEPRVAVAAAVALAQGGREADVDAAEATLERLIADHREAAASGRREAAMALAHVTAPRFRLLLVPLLYDHDMTVAEQAIRTARSMGAADGLFLPALISLLGHRTLKGAARATLVHFGEPIVAALGYALNDRREEPWVRRHIPATLALLPTRPSMDALVLALDDPDGFLRYKAIVAIERLRREHPEIPFPPASIDTRVMRESARYYNYLTLQHNLHQHPAGRNSLLGRALVDKLGRTLDRLYRLLGLRYGVDDVAAARYTMEHGDPRSRAAALEYLDNILGGQVRRRVLPILDDTPVEEKVRLANLFLKTRPRDIDDTLAQLVHDDDPVIAAAAIHFVDRQELANLRTDLDFIIEHHSRKDRLVMEAAAWALLPRRHSNVLEGACPAVEMADRARAIPLFGFVSIDELFRMATTGAEVRHAAGRELHQEGAPADDVQILLEGAVTSLSASGGATRIGAPAVLGLENVLQSGPHRASLTAMEDTVCLRLSSPDFLTLVSDNVLLAQDLFRMLLAPSVSSGRPVHMTPLPGVTDRTEARTPVEQALRLRQHPLFARATASQLMSIVGVARDVPLTAGAVLFDSTHSPAIYQVVQGEIHLQSDRTEPVVAGPGTTIGVAETLAGEAPHGRATVARDGCAVYIGREELFTVLADHIDLMQGLFSGVLELPATASTEPAGLVPPRGVDY